MNITPIPNFIYSEMKNMKDTDLRVVLLIARMTLGWVLDEETGMRKREDWISQSEIIKTIGRKRSSVSISLRKCIANHWIEARASNGKMLNSPRSRSAIGRGGKIYFRMSDNKKPVEEEKPIELGSVEVDPNIKRKDFTVPKELYKEITDKYQLYKGITLGGAEFGEVKRAIKTMLYSGRTKENIIDFMKFCWQVVKDIQDGDTAVEQKYGWLQNWTLLTIKRKMPEFIAGKFDIKRNYKKIPDYCKDFVIDERYK